MRHFIAYHSEARMQYKAEDCEPFSLYTSKNICGVGDKIWTITGTGKSPMQYWLCDWFVVDTVEKADHQDFGFTVAGTHGQVFKPMLRLDTLGWFKAFREKMANFSLGLTQLKQPIISALQLATEGIGETRLTKQCVYTIRHSKDLSDAVNSGGRATFTEKKNWASAEQLLARAKREGERLPILFAPAEDTGSLFAWGTLDEIVAGETTEYFCSNLQLFKPRPKKTSLRLFTTNKPLARGFIRPYAICHTPRNLSLNSNPVPTGPATYLLTWNPMLWYGKLADNETVSWSCGNTKRICPGDRLFLMRQGSEPRGICAAGVAVSDAFTTDKGLYVRMNIEKFKDPKTESILSRPALDEMNVGVPHPMKWSIQSSGTQIPTEVAQRLETAWQKLCTNESSTNDQEGIRIRFIDPELLRRIEEAAVEFVRSDLKGWSIRSREHEANLGFDLECSRGSEVMHLEVKGTTESYPCFNLQASQYTAASKDKLWRIAVVTNALQPKYAKITYYDGETFLKSFTIDPTQYRASLKDYANP